MGYIPSLINGVCPGAKLVIRSPAAWAKGVEIRILVQAVLHTTLHGMPSPFYSVVDSSFEGHTLIVIIGRSLRSVLIRSLFGSRT